MGWKTVEINTDDYLQLYLNNLLIKKPTGNITINLVDIDTLLLNNNRTSLSIRLINALTRNNINVIIFNEKHEPQTLFLPVSGNHNSLKVLEKQISWTNIYKGKTWQKVIKNKIENQKSLLKKVKHDISILEYMDTMISQVREFDVTNREGHAAKIYWHCLFNGNFKRDYQSNENIIINSMLNYGYAILRGMVIKSIIKKGLDTRISLFHKSFSNFFALSCDLMEPFRPIIDMVVFKNKDINLFTIEIKEELIKSLTGKITINNKKYYINNAIDKCVEHLIAGKSWLWIDIWE